MYRALLPAPALCHTQSCLELIPLFLLAFILSPSKAKTAYPYYTRILKILKISPCMHAKLLSRVHLFATPGTVACQVPLSMRFSRQEYWSGLSCPPPGDLPDPGIKLPSPCIGRWIFTTELPEKPQNITLLWPVIKPGPSTWQARILPLKHQCCG